MKVSFNSMSEQLLFEALAAAHNSGKDWVSYTDLHACRGTVDKIVRWGYAYLWRRPPPDKRQYAMQLTEEGKRFAAFAAFLIRCRDEGKNERLS